MSAKDKILEKIRKNKPQEQVELPPFKAFEQGYPDITEAFKARLEKNGAAVHIVSEKELEQNFSIWEKEEELLIFAPSRKKTVGKIDASTDKHQLKHLRLAVLEAQTGVAENGAMWVDESNFPHRAIPYITRDLILIVNASELVNNMHEAYQKISIAHTGYGVFIAGPSKTADIEQSLVIGAHGAISLQVYIVK